MIYFIRCALTGRVKIGFSEKPWSRLVKMRVDCPTELVMASVIEGDKAAEAALHKRFAAFHVRGEWFSETAELRDFVMALPIAERPRTPKFRLRVSKTRLCQYMTERGLTDEAVSRATGISRPTICRLRAGKRRPGLGTARKLSQFTGVPWEELFFSEAA